MRKRNVTITIRCTEDERQRIYNKARQHGLTLSDFVLRSSLGKRIVTADGLADVLKEQKSIGRNLNQIALLGNMGRLKSVRLDELIAQHERATVPTHRRGDSFYRYLLHSPSLNVSRPYSVSVRELPLLSLKASTKAGSLLQLTGTSSGSCMSSGSLGILLLYGFRKRWACVPTPSTAV